MKFWIVAALLLAGIVPAHAANYFVDNCVTVGNDSNNGTSSATPWLTIAKVNASSFSANDTISLRSSCTWNEQMNVPSSGTAGNPITITNYGSGALPILMEGAILSGFTLNGGNVWQLTTTQPGQVIFNNAIGIGEGSQGAVTAANEWFWGGGVLYVFSTTDPATAYTAPGIASLYNQYGINTNAKSNLNISNIQAQYAKFQDILIGQGSSSVTVSGVKVFHAYGACIYILGPGSGPAETNDTVTTSEVAYCGSHGVQVGDWVSTALISHNSIHNTSLGPFDFISGIHICGNGTDINGVTAEYNEVSFSGISPPTGNQRGAGIWADCNEANIIFRYNSSHDNVGTGIYIEITSGALVYGNLSYNNVGYTTGAATVGIDVSAHTSTPVNNNLIYNNTVFGNGFGGITIRSDNSANPLVSNNQIINNSVFGNGTAGSWQFGVCFAENDGTHSTGNVYTFNAFGTQTTNFMFWGCAPSYLSTYAAFDSAYGSATHSITTAPSVLTNYSLAAGSSCIDAGTNLGTTYQLDLSPASVWPIWTNGVLLANQNNFGAGWDCGAFVYLGTPQEPGIGTSISGVTLKVVSVH